MARHGVILLHGIFRTERSMRKLAKFLQKNDYEILNLDFPSTKFSIEEIVDLIQPQIAEFCARCDQVSFVGYSMGGLVIRAYLHKYRMDNLCRVVMLGTPNSGSELADLAGKWKLYKKFYGPAGQQLGTLQDHFKHIFGRIDYELGIIAGNWTIDPISSMIIKGPNDGKVSVANTKIDGMKDHFIVPIPHTFLTVSKKVFRQTLAFLNNGKFSKKN